MLMQIAREDGEMTFTFDRARNGRLALLVTEIGMLLSVFVGVLIFQDAWGDGDSTRALLAAGLAGFLGAEMLRLAKSWRVIRGPGQ